MATYIVLTNFTDQGIRTVKDTTKRAAAVREMAKKCGIEMKDIYWTLGSHDLVVTFEAPDDATFTAFGLSLGAAGNVRTQTLRAFSTDEMTGILSKMP
ncbi:GYD domain-containing protein [Collimonas silvisoli]|uniref:GYD domain-containing protein n=1 Tax=Collimonas silvisoli TaxID=2825884 RepID=UPI001B8AD901|nr:GYD domain-containing protein [Collimonas silvisoli]